MPGPFDSLFGSSGLNMTSQPGTLMSFLGAPTPDQANLEKDTQLERALFTKMGQLAKENPGVDQGKLLTLLLNDPAGVEAITGFSTPERLKSSLSTALQTRPEATPFNVPENSTTFGLTPGSTTPVPLAQGGSETIVRNPADAKTAIIHTPGQALGPQQPAEPRHPAQLTPEDEDLIIEAEGTAAKGNDPFNEVLGYGKWGLPSKPLTQMTLGDVKLFGKQMRMKQAQAGVPWAQTSSAVGAFQLTSRTMSDAQRALGYTDDTVFTEDVQRDMAAWVKETQGAGAWEGFKKNPELLKRFGQADVHAATQPAAEVPGELPGGQVSTSSQLDPSAAKAEGDMSKVEQVFTQPKAMTRAEYRKTLQDNPILASVAGPGVGSWVLATLGPIARQVDPKLDVDGSEAATIAKAQIANLRKTLMAVDGTSRLRLQADAVLGVMPDSGFIADPKEYLLQLQALRSATEDQMEVAQNMYNDPEMKGSAANKESAKDIYDANKLLHVIPSSQEIDGMLRLIEQHPEGLPTPKGLIGSAIDSAEQTLESAGEQTGITGPPSGRGPQASGPASTSPVIELKRDKSGKIVPK